MASEAKRLAANPLLFTAAEFLSPQSQSDTLLNCRCVVAGTASTG
jgi:hypothetical protein